MRDEDFEKLNLQKLKLNQLTKIDYSIIEKFNLDQMRQYTQMLAFHANRRLSALKKSGAGITQATRPLQNAGVDKFTTKGKSIDELRNQWRLATNFLKAKTSTVRGHKKFVSEFEDASGVDFAKLAKGETSQGEKETADLFFSVLNYIKEHHPIMYNNASDNKQKLGIVKKYVADKNKGLVDIINEINKDAKEEYEAEQRKRMGQFVNPLDLGGSNDL